MTALQAVEALLSSCESDGCCSVLVFAPERRQCLTEAALQQWGQAFGQAKLPLKAVAATRG